MSAILCLDVEGSLYKDAFAVGAVVKDLETGREVDSMYSGIPWKDEYADSKDSVEYITTKVIPHLPKPNRETPREMRDDFWQFYMKHKEKYNLIIVADCGVPIESYFFRMCVLDDFENRKWKAPYPLHELGTMLLACGKDPIGFYGRQQDEEPAHHPTNDARQSARLFFECLNTLK